MFVSAFSYFLKQVCKNIQISSHEAKTHLYMTFCILEYTKLEFTIKPILISI